LGLSETFRKPSGNLQETFRTTSSQDQLAKISPKLLRAVILSVIARLSTVQYF
jgi:hypothetical protein